MRFLRPVGWRFVAAPLAVWLLVGTCGMAGLLWLQSSGRATLIERFHLRVGLAADFVTTYVADLIEREQVQAAAFLTDAQVSERDFTRSVNGFGYPAALLLDDKGRVLHVAPRDASLIGRDVSGRYPHLRTAVVEGRPAVSPVVPSAARGIPVVGFAVPFDTAAGRRVFSGAVQIERSPLASYLSTAISLSGVKVELADASGATVAANHPYDPRVPTLNTREPDLAAALQKRPQGRYRHDTQWWHYASQPIAGTPWRLSATVSEQVLFAPVAGNEAGIRAALGAAALVGLLVLAAVSRARANRQQLRLSEQRFRKVFDHSRIGMALTDPRGRFLRVNPALCQMFGYTEDQLLRRHFADVSHPGDLDASMKGLRDCLAGRMDGFETDKRYQHADGHTVETSITVALLRDDYGRPQHFATQIIDVTERRALERARQANEAELAERAERLQRANTQMADFLAMLSHDVRQPLSSVVASAEMLLDDWNGTDDATKQHYVKRMNAGGHRADAIVTGILTLAQLDAGAVTAQPVRFDVSHAVRQAVTALNNEGDHPITVTAPDEASGFADPAHLQLMLSNLLGNAVKYGRPPVEVTVRGGPDRVQIRISDHGNGVPPQFVPRLFDRFARADTGVATVKPGTGLGLYFVRQLAHASGLSIDYEPHRPHGATFVLTVPTTPPPPTRRHTDDQHRSTLTPRMP